MRRLLTILLAGLLVGAIAAPAFAWEFSMKGEQEWRFRFFTRSGPNDLFGKNAADLDIGFAGQNIYGHGGNAAIPALNPVPAATIPSAIGLGATGTGLRAVRGGFSIAGPDAFYNDSRLTLYPEIRVNPAIRTFGVYTIGGYRNKYRQWNDISQFQTYGTNAPWGVGVPPFERYYMHQSSPNAYDTASIGSWEQFRFTVQTPWCIWSLGIKDFPFGTGASLSNNVRAESFFTVVPYGPFRLMHALWSAQNALNISWGVAPDPDLKPTFMQAFAMTYENGPVSMGAQYFLQKLHVKRLYNTTPLVGVPGSVPGAAGIGTLAANNGYDRNLAQWIFYAKYNNGRFFANAEYAWANMDRYFLGVPAGSPLTGARPSFWELYHWFAEAGVMAGPSKVTFMAATASGPVLNNGNPTKSYQPYPINYQAMEPYEWLMFNTYGGGNQTYSALLTTDDGHGMMADGFCYAGRIDYAVASNLNVWGSYIWAHRLEKNGFLFGGIASTGASLAATSPVIATFAANAGRANNGSAIPYGFVTDGFIGWEAGAGIDWKLLENFTAYLRYAYWQPGEFFREAYQARLPNAASGLAQDNLPLSRRDAIQAFQWSLMVNF